MYLCMSTKKNKKGIIMIYIEFDKNILEKVENITKTNYKSENGLVNSDNIETIIDDLLGEIDNLRNKIEDLEEDMRDNYERVTQEEQLQKCKKYEDKD